MNQNKSKYRVLTQEELSGMEKEFVEFLVVNGITAPQWETLKVTDQNKAQRLIELFSDVVFESIMRKTRYLTFASPRQLMCFECGDEIIKLMCLETANADIDLSKTALTPEVLKECKLFSQIKPYGQLREQEIFNMTQQGCLLDDGAAFRQLEMVLGKTGK